MRKSLFALILLAVLFGCTKQEDSTDKFVGTYSLSMHETGTWGSAPINLTSEGVAIITKVGTNRVKMTGSFSTYGIVSGSVVMFESTTSTDSAGSITTSFTTGSLSGNMLSFNANMTGYLKSSGVSYPLSSTVRVVGYK